MLAWSLPEDDFLPLLLLPAEKNRSKIGHGSQCYNYVLFSAIFANFLRKNCDFLETQ
jgi:hypothetical protein